MDRFLIKGGKALRGTVAISGAKNSALPAMAAALLTEEQVTLHNIPKVRDLITMSKLLAFMGASVSVTEMPASDYVLAAPALNHAEAPYELVKTMRASILTLGPLMARTGMARVSLPGGCAIGGAAGGFAFGGAGKDGRGDHDRARIHPGARAKGRTAEGCAHRVRKNYRDGDGKHFDGGGAGRRRNGAGEFGARAGGDGFGGDAAEDGREDRGRRDFDAADSRRGEIAWDGAHGDSRPHRSGDVSDGGGDYRRRLDDYALCAG